MFKSIRKQEQDMFETPIDDLVCKDHPYRKLLRIVNFERLCASLKVLFCENKGRKGYHFESGFKALVLQWTVDGKFKR